MAREEDLPDSIDLEALDLGPMLRHARTATFAPNWKMVLAADGSVGLFAIIAGVILTNWVAWAGWILVVIGLIYSFLVIRRFLQWRWLRRHAGLG